MSIQTDRYPRLEEYENFQKTNLEYFPNSYEDWMFGRRIKDEQERNAPITEKISLLAKTNFYKLLVAISRGDKERAMNIKISLLNCVLFIDVTLQHILDDKRICTAITVFFCSYATLYLNPKLNSLYLLTNQTTHLE
jgi:hypothetical protein